MMLTRPTLAFALAASLLLAAANLARAQAPPPNQLSPSSQQAVALLDKVQAATEAAKTLTADFTYTSVTPHDSGPATRHDEGTARLMKPNFADIEANIAFDSDARYSEHIVSDGTTLWTYYPATNLYTKARADSHGKNINVWRLITIGGFFSVYTWMRQGIYVGDLSELTYAGKETVDGAVYQVIEHKMIGTILGKACPFDQKIYIGTDNLIHRFTLSLTRDGKPGSELATLTNIKTGQPMTPASFAFAPPPGSQEKPTVP